MPPVEGHKPFKEDEHVTREADDSEPFSALAFKIMSDAYVGRLTYLRVYSGVLHSGTHVLNCTKDRKERIGRVLQMHANHREDLEAAYTGDIVAVVGLKHSTTGDTICDPDKPVVLESITSPSRSSRSRWSPRPRPTRTSWAPGSPSSRTRTPPSS